MGKAGAHAGVSKRTKFTRPPAATTTGRTAFAPSQRHTNVQPRGGAIPDEYISAQKTITTTTISKTSSSWEGLNNDSDKENWSPDEDGNPRSFRTTTVPPSSSGRHPLPSAARSMAAAKLDGSNNTNRNPRRTTTAAALQEPRRRAVASLQRGSTAPGSWSSYAARRRQGGGGRPSLQGRSQSALEIYEDGAGGSEEEDDDGEDREDAACERLLEMCGGVGGVSPSKEKAVAAATGLLSLKWGR
jgi:hypothetical protein